MIDIGIFATSLAGSRLDFPTWRARDVRWGDGEHGFEEFSCTIPCSLTQAFFLYTYQAALFVKVTMNGGKMWEGRLEKPTLSDAGVQITAYGGWRALSDVPYTALWSDSQTDTWRPVVDTEIAVSATQRMELDTQNRLYWAPRNGESYDNGQNITIGYRIPNGSSRQIVGIEFDWSLTAPVNWQFYIQRRTATWGFVANILIANATGAAQTGRYHAVVTACDAIGIILYFNAAAAVYGGLTGAAFLSITNVRVVTSTTNRISTTFTVNRAAGVGVTATVGSTARMYVGQRLSISNAAGTVTESVIVLTIPSGTTFTATFVNNYVIGDSVSAHVVYADEIVKDMIATVAAVNTNQLSSSTGLVQSPAIDTLDRVYADAEIGPAISDLVTQGDSSQRLWEAGVFENQALYFRPRGSAGQIWYVDATSLQVIRTLENLYNSAYSVYEDASGWPLRGTVSADTTSVTRYGLTRRTAVVTQTTSLIQANVARDTLIAQSKEVTPQSSVTFDRVYTANGALGRLWDVRSGDTFILRNLPPNLGTDINKIQRFILLEKTYSPEANTLEVVPEAPRPTIDVLLTEPVS